MKAILIIRLSSIGDVLHCTPVVRSLKMAWPECRITWLVGEIAAELLTDNPYIDEIMVWSRERFDNYLKKLEFAKAFALWGDLKKALAARRFDVALDIHGLFLTGMIARLVQTDRRIGMSRAREFNSLFMTETAEPLGRHIIDRYLGVLAPLGITTVDRKMILNVPEKEQHFAETFLRNAGISPGERFVVFVPGTTWITKNWPAEFFARTGQIIGKNFKIVLCGGKAEVAMGDHIQKKAGLSIVNAIDRTGLLEMAGIIQQAAAVVTGDTGPLYIAAALGVPTVAIFGPTDPGIYAPPGQTEGVLVSKGECSFCHKTKCPRGAASCMSKVKPEAVAEAVYQAVKGW
ncbi:MAG: glycosyltransferase family 9 protein [Veillonellales bacterium]